jgi:hypothetical protein
MIINDYVINLVDNLPNYIKNTKQPIKIDLVLSGGLFNGSYQIGSLMVLKEMEKRNYIKIKRISACSIGTITGLLYFIDKLDLFYEIYQLLVYSFKKTPKFHDINQILCDHIQKKEFDTINKKNFFISYNNVLNLKKIIKKKYKNKDDLFEAMKKSCFLPYVIDGNLLYNKKYIDGFTPFFFPQNPNRQLLYLNAIPINKMSETISVKNEKTNIHRILLGILEMNTFYIKKSNTNMCIDLKKISNISKFYFYVFFFIVEKMILIVLYILLKIKMFVKKKIYNLLF